MWKKLVYRYAVSNMVALVQLQTILAILRFSGLNMCDLVDYFEEIYSRLSGMGSVISEEMQVVVFMAFFPQ